MPKHPPVPRRCDPARTMAAIPPNGQAGASVPRHGPGAGNGCRSASRPSDMPLALPPSPIANARRCHKLSRDPGAAPAYVAGAPVSGRVVREVRLQQTSRGRALGRYAGCACRLPGTPGARPAPAGRTSGAVAA